VRLVAPLLFGDALFLAQPVAVRRRLVPRHPAYGTRRLGVTKHLVVGKLRPEVEELLLRHRLGSDDKRPSDPLLGLPLICPPPLFRGWRSHGELHRARDHHQRLALTVDVPLWRGLLLVLRDELLDALQALRPLFLVLGPLVVDLAQPRLLLPRPQQ